MGTRSRGCPRVRQQVERLGHDSASAQAYPRPLPPRVRKTKVTQPASSFCCPGSHGDSQGGKVTGRREGLTGQVFEGRVGTSANDCNLAEHGERDTVGTAGKVLNLPVGVWFLLAKLVAREGEHVEMVGTQVPLQLLQGSVVFVCEATFASYVHHQRNLRGRNKTEEGSEPYTIQRGGMHLCLL